MCIYIYISPLYWVHFQPISSLVSLHVTCLRADPGPGRSERRVAPPSAHSAHHRLKAVNLKPLSFLGQGMGTVDGKWRF